MDEMKSMETINGVEKTEVVEDVIDCTRDVVETIENGGSKKRFGIALGVIAVIGSLGFLVCKKLKSTVTKDDIKETSEGIVDGEEIVDEKEAEE